ncbi:MAG: succinyldiaminopimelate transaminase [Gammaproteobacteria bacterium]|nr:MAG: succinyldiaminopimelate transaminase [Gammaproteobacteria bacterium]
MNPDLRRLQPYPFEKLRALLADTRPVDKPHIALSIGEPKHATPAFVVDTLKHNLGSLSNYPLTRGLPELRQAVAGWLQRRFAIPRPIDPESEVLPVNGTREALFALAQAVVDRSRSPLVISPNPFYQIYEGAALLAGAQPHYLPCSAQTGYLPDFDAVANEVWERCQLIYVCSPGNPTGAVMSEGDWQRLIELAERHDFIIAADECYSEIYFDEGAPPAGLLQAAAAMGHDDFRRCVVFHSLSKRSNAPGLRSGFVAGDRILLERFLRYRTYHGCAMPLPAQHASIAAWNDEAHVRHNRDLYRAKFETVLEILQPVLDVQRPDAGFYLWARVPDRDDEAFARGLFEQQHLTVLPGSYLSREVDGLNPGAGHVRMALVASPEECAEAARRIRSFIEAL